MKKYIIIQFLGYKHYSSLEDAKKHVTDSGQKILEVSGEWTVDIKKTLIGSKGGS